MKPVRTVEFQGITYSLYEISPKQLDGQVITVGEDDLNLAFMEVFENEHERSEVFNEALRIDQDIYCFMPDFILEDTEEKVLAYFDEYFD